MNSQTRDRAVTAIAHHLAEALLIALESAQDARSTQSAPVAAAEPVTPTPRAPGSLLTVEDVAERLAVAAKTVRNWQYLAVPYGPSPIKVGRYLRWKSEVVAEWLAAQRMEHR